MSRDNELDSDFDEDYIYDDLYRLTDFDRADGFDQSWNDLDVLGNWSTFDNDGTSQTREVNEANEIEKIDGSPNDVAYDAAGNMIEVPKLDGSGEHFCLKYDAWNRLAAVYDDNGTTLIAKYEYDAAGRRIEKETYSAGSLDEARHYYYCGTWQCIEERVEASGVLPGDADVQYVWGAKYVDNLILRDRDTDADGAMDERLYALADANYNVTALFDEATGTVVERFVYDAYGNVTELDPDDFTAYTGTDYEWEYTYTTRRLDEETGLMYYRMRYYDADLGRFVSRDPIGYWAGDGNLYRYVQGSPVVYVDPSGLLPGCWYQQWNDEHTRRTEEEALKRRPQADGKFGRPYVVNPDQALEMISKVEGKHIVVDTKEWMPWLPAGAIIDLDDLGQVLNAQAIISSLWITSLDDFWNVVFGKPTVGVVEIGSHGGPDGIRLGPKFSNGPKPGDGERTVGTKITKNNVDELVKTIKDNANLTTPCMIVLTGCCTGNSVSSAADPSWVQKLADDTGCTVLAPGGFMNGGFLRKTHLGTDIKRYGNSAPERGTDTPGIPGNSKCYPSRDRVVYVFPPNPKRKP